MPKEIAKHIYNQNGTEIIEFEYESKYSEVKRDTVYPVITYFINEKKGTVVCIKYNCRYDFRDYMFNKYGILKIPAQMSESKFLHNDMYIGKAVCHPEDVFNKDIGMKLALKRMNSKYRRVQVRCLKNLRDLLFDYANKSEQIVIDIFNKLD